MIRINIVCIGDELLDGRTTDRNSGVTARMARDFDAELDTVTWVRDDHAQIVDALERAARTAPVVVVSGGLGPTSDDITRDAAAAWVGRPLEMDEERLAWLQARFAERNYPFTANNARQCAFPAGAEILATEVGTAAGFALAHHGARILFFPGVPYEFEWFARTYLMPHLATVAGRAPAHRQRFEFHGIGESHLEAKLDNIDALVAREGGRLGYRASYPSIELTLRARTAEGLARLERHVRERVGEHIVSEGPEALPERVGRLLAEAGATVTVAESCTGGLLGARITDISGSSRWFERGYITYANAAKVEELGVRPETLARHGAVSLATVCQMALGARRRSGATFALAISGIAGPTGGSADKPVGTVHFALATDEGVYHRRVLYAQRSRDQVRQASVYTALALLLWKLEGRLLVGPAAAHRIDGPFAAEHVDSDHFDGSAHHP